MPQLLLNYLEHAHLHISSHLDCTFNGLQCFVSVYLWRLDLTEPYHQLSGVQRIYGKKFYYLLLCLLTILQCCVHLSLCVQVAVCAQVSVCWCLCIQVSVHTYLCAQVSVCLSVSMFSYLCVQLSVCSHVCAYISVCSGCTFNGLGRL